MSSLADRLAARRVRLWTSRDLVAHTTAAIAQLPARVAAWRRDSRAGTELAYMSLRELRDIGISPAERDREINKLFWRP